MKKLLCVLLCAVILCGCGSDCSDEAACPLPAEQPAATATVFATPVPSPEPTPEPSPTPRPLLPPKTIDGSIDECLFGSANEQGYVTELFYETCDYAAGGTEPIEKRMVVYVPYGYDPQKQYNVLFLSHIMSWNENFWFWTDFGYPSPEGGHSGLFLFDMLDNMIELGYCEPVIVVSVNNYLYEQDSWSHYSSRTYSQFGREFAEDILPCVAENYSTYASGSSREELSAAREHFGFMGASFGAYVTYNCIMQDCFDLVSNFAVTGGGSMDGSLLINRWTALGHQDYSMDHLFFGQGEYDDRAGPEGGYYNLHYYPEYFSDGNLHLIIYPGLGHEERAWVNTVYNSLQLFFR